jgi:limonene-1,2-epoxide hydrolase
MSRSPKETVQTWVDAFNRADVDALVALYAPDAVNHQVAYEPLEGRENIRRLFETEFARAAMVCHIENLFEDGDWSILEWSDPNGLRGCGFFHVVDGQIVLQRGYFDRLTFYKAQDIPLEDVIR